MSRVASAANAMGVSEEQLSAMLAVMIETTRQAPESIGVAVKSILSRMTDIEAGVDMETTLGNYTEEMNSFGINVLDVNGSLRDMGEVIEEIGGKWSNFTREQQVGLSQALGGVRQYTYVLSLFENWDRYETALSIAKNAEGTLQQQQEIYMESTEAHLQQLSTSFEDLADSILDATTINNFADSATKVLKVVTSLVDAIGGGGNALLSLGSIATKVFSSQIATGIATFINNMNIARDTAEQLRAEVEITDMFKDIAVQDSYLETLVNMKKEINSLRDVTTQAQNEQANSIIKTTNELQNQEAAWKENLAALSEYMLNSNIGAIDWGEGALKNQTENIKTYRRQFEEITKDFQDNSKQIANAQKILDNTRKSYMKYTKEPGNKEFSEEYINSLIKAESVMTDIENLLDEIVNSGRIPPEQAAKLNQAYKDYNQTLIDSNDELDEIAFAGEDLLRTINEVNSAGADDAKRFSSILEKEIGGELDNISDKIRMAEQDWNNFIKGIKTVQIIQQMVNIASAVGQIASGLSTLKNLGNIWNDENLSASDKMLQTLLSISTSVPMIISGVKTLTGSIVGLAVGLGAVESTEVGVIAATKALGIAFYQAIVSILPIILAITAAVGGLSFVIYEVHQAITKTERDLAKATEEAENLNNSFKKLNSTYQEFLNTASQYQGIVDSLKELKKNTNEYEEAVARANEQALILLDTNEELQASAYRTIDGLIEFKEGALEAIEASKKTDVENTRQLSFGAKQNINQIKIEANYDELRNLLDTNLLDEQTIQDLVNIYNENGGLIDSDIQQLSTISDQLKNEIINNKDEVIQLISSIGTLTKSNDFLSSELARSYLGENNAAYREQSEIVQSAVSSMAGSIYKDTQEYKDSFNEALKEFNSQTDKAVHEQYAELLGLTAVKNGFGTGTFEDQEGNTVKIDDESIRRLLAEREATKSTLGEDSELITRFIEITELFQTIGQNIGEQIGADGLDTELLGFIQKRDTSFDEIGGLSEEQINQIRASLTEDLFGDLDWNTVGYENAQEFFEGVDRALNEYNPEALNEKMKITVSETEGDLSSFMPRVQSGEVNFRNVLEDEQYLSIIENLEQISREYEGLDSSVAVLNKTWEVGTQNYIQALENVQDALYNIKMDNLIQDAQEASSEFEKLFSQNNNFDIDINANPDEFYDAMDALLEANYAIDIAIHAEAEQEFNSIMDAMDDVYDKAKMIGEGFIVAADSVRELNNTFPGIIEGLEIVGDGTVKLNEDIVNAAVGAAEAEIAADAQATVARLQNQATLLRQKQRVYEEMAEAAHVLATAETGTETDSCDARATLNAKLNELKQINSQITANSEMTNEKEVADSSNENAGITAKNWNESFQSAAKSSFNFAQAAIKNMKAAASGEGETTLGDFRVEYRGSSGTSKEASILEDLQKELDNASGNFNKEFYAKQEEQLKNLANSAGLAANDIEGMIASIGAKTVEVDKGFSNIRKGYGEKGKSPEKAKAAKEEKEKDPKLLEFLEDEFDRYHDINLIIKDITVNLQRMEKQQDKLYGRNLLDNMNKQLVILERQKKAYQEKINIAKQEMSELQTTLSAQGVTFGDDGYILNYMSALQAKLDYTNSVIESYNSMSAEEQEAFEDTVEAAKKDYEEFKKDISDYDNRISEMIPDLEDSIQDAINREIEIRISKFKMEVELRVDMSEMEREFNDFQKHVVDRIKETDILGNAKADVKNFKSYYDTFDTGIGSVQALTNQVTNTMKEIQQIDSTGWADFYGDNKAQAMEDLKQYYDELREQLEEIRDLEIQIRHYYIEMIEEAVTEFQKQVDQYDYINDIITHDLNLMSLMYGDRAYDSMNSYYEKIEQNNNQELDFLKKRTAYAEEMMNKETDPEAREKWEEEWENSLQQLNQKVEESVQNLIDKYMNSINKVFDELNKKVTGGMGLDYTTEEWYLINENADQYLDTINALYGMQKLENKYLDAIDKTTNIKNQEKLNNLMNEQLGMLRDKDKLTQYDVDRANMMYEIALKEIALQEAQDNKSKMRLRRNSQGNYEYQYVTDEDAIKDAEDELMIAQNDLYNFDKEHYKQNLDDIYGYYVEFQQKYKEIMTDMSLTDEEKQQRTLLLQEQYGQLINGLVEQNEDIKLNLQESAFMALEGLYNQNAESFEKMTGMGIEAFRRLTDEQQKNIVGQMVPQWNSGIQSMIDIFAGNGGFIPTCQDAFDQLDETTNDYQNSLDDLQAAAGIDFEMIAEGYDLNIEKAQELLWANDDLIEKYREQIDAILDVISELDMLIDQYYNVQQAAIDATEAAYAFIQAQQAAAAFEASKDVAAGPQGIIEDTSDLAPPTSLEDKVINTPSSPTPSAPEPPPAPTEDEGGNGIPEIGDVVTYTGGLYYYDSYGTNPSGSRGPGRKVTIVNINEDAPFPIAVKSNDSAYGWLKKSQIKGYDTGGYTGDWADDGGKLAVLHQKELILNAKDTENILAAVSLVRDMDQLLDNLSNNMLDRISGLMMNLSPNLSFTNDIPNTELEQNVTITAEFPNVQKSSEIEEAFNNLINIASMRANTNLR